MKKKYIYGVYARAEAAASRNKNKYNKNCALDLMDAINGNKELQDQITLKKAKKLLRNPQKVFVTKECRFIKCPKCGNPKVTDDR